LYRDLAKTPKRQELGVIQAAIDDAVTHLGVHSSLIVTPNLGKKLATLDWKMTNPEDLSTGIHPSSVGYKTPAERQEQLALIALHAMVMENGTAPSLQDAQLLRLTDHVSITLSITGGRYTMLNLLLVSYVGLGSVHPMSTEIHNFVVDYERHEPRLESLVPPPQVQKALIPAFMVRYVQLRFSRWIETQLNSSTPVAPPQLTTLFDKIFVGEQWTPPFPAAYLEPAYPQQALP
jgi:hypothetical protein